MLPFKAATVLSVFDEVLLRCKPKSAASNSIKMNYFKTFRFEMLLVIPVSPINVKWGDTKPDSPGFDKRSHA